MNFDEALLTPVYYRKLQYQRQRGVTVRLLSPLAHYPPGAFSHKDAAVIMQDDLAALITMYSPLDEPEDHFTEVEFASAYEVRCISAVILSSKENAMYSFYPASFEVSFPVEDADLTDAALIEKLINRFRHLLLQDGVRKVADQHHPPIMGGKPYSINSYAEQDFTRQAEIFEAIDVNDHLLIRGLGALIQSVMLSLHREFLESACMSLWVALDASLQMILQKLKDAGQNNPSAEDASQYVAVAFQNTTPPTKYFEDFYEDRIKTMHPASRFGIYPSAPLMADDFYDLYEDLVPTYDFLITGHAKERFLKASARTGTAT